MRLAAPTYPVDRYLESSEKFEMVNLIDDDLWHTEPALQPEDEIILRKLHDMLQSTAEDLRVLSQELGKHHEPGVLVKTAPMPLDEDFNNKVHIEEIVNAKFHGHKIIDASTAKIASAAAENRILNQTFVKERRREPVTLISVQNNRTPILKSNLNKNLGFTRTKTLQISEPKVVNCSDSKYDKPKVSESVSYSEISFKYEPIPSKASLKPLNIQHMPRINIRSELKEQKVLHLDIIPENNNQTQATETNNVGVIEVKHDLLTQTQLNKDIHRQKEVAKEPVRRKVTVMSVGESTESANNNSSDYRSKLKTKGQIQSTMKASPKTTARNKPRKALAEKKETLKESNQNRTHINIAEWKKKLSNVYGKPSNSRNNVILQPKSHQARLNYIKRLSDRNIKKGESNTKPRQNILNNAEYIPYSYLTLGGVRVSDIERELSDGPIKNDAPLSPILDKLISSHENSVNVSPRNLKSNKAIMLSKSDENLLHDVLDLEDQISKTFTSNNEIKSPKISPIPLKKEQSDTSNSYSNDEFEEAEKTDKSTSDTSERANDKYGKSENVAFNKDNETDSNSDVRDTTFTKAQNLSFKDSVDIHEFIHSIDTQDNATQSNKTHISLKETQTSPRNESSNIKPTKNDLSIDPKSEIENLFKLEKEMIKKLIIDEYGDLLKESITKPSTSKDINYYDLKNMITSQKNTQTSPLHMKCVMTSPTRTKTRTTSPFTLNVTIEQQTSPMIFLNDKELHLEHTDMSDAEDIGISINLSSPRFSLRLPQTSREVLSNMENCSQKTTEGKIQNTSKRSLPVQMKAITSSTSVDADGSSSEISSLGEVKFRLKRRLKKNRITTFSESSSTSTVSKSSSDFQIGSVLPLRSEGELSLKQRTGESSRRNGSRKSKTDDEKSLGQC